MLDQLKENPYLLTLEKVSRQFPGVLALDRVDFDLKPGEVHVLFGENGAGKSTLISIIAGALAATSGQMVYRGNPAVFRNVHSARSQGIHAVFQEFSLVSQFTVAQNLSLGTEKSRCGILQKREGREKAREVLERLGFGIDLDQKVATLSRAEQQMVEIAKVFSSDLSVLILDEPTASLTEKETDRLFRLIEQAKKEQVGIIYITHRMGEIRRISDRITILRDGRHIKTVNTRDVTDKALVEMMTGRVIDKVFPSIRFNPDKTVLSLSGVTNYDHSVQKVSLAVKKGEIVGLAGLVGSGKSRTMRACFGIDPLAQGQILFKGETVKRPTPSRMLRRGMFYVPPDRHNEGLVMMRSVRENITLPSLALSHLSCYSGFLKRKQEWDMAERLSRKLNLSPNKPSRRVESFSGGNQQKALLSRVLTRDIALYVFDEPTVGVDIGTRTAIYEFIKDLCEQGAAVVLISSDLPEILNLSRRCYVFYRGTIQAELKGNQINEQQILHHFFGRKADPS
jgi:ribose transport system ATP-binding protein